MKTDIHPQDYRLVVFQDLNNKTSFLIKSTARTKETIKHTDGQTYPLVKLHITSASHPFYTGLEKVIDVEGRIDKFKSRRQAAKDAQNKLQAKSLKALKKATKPPTDKRKSKPPKALKKATKPPTDERKSKSLDKSIPQTEKTETAKPADSQNTSGDDKA